MVDARHPDLGHPLRRSIELPGPVDLQRILSPLRHGTYDPTIRFGAGSVWRSMRTPDGAATLALSGRGCCVRALAWGPGARRALEAAPGIAGALDEPERFRPQHPLLQELARRLAGVRLTRSGQVMDALVPAILEQKVTGLEAQRAWRGIVRAWGEPAPGPGGLWLPPSPEVLAAQPYHRYHPFGVEARRADLIRRSCARAARLAALAAVDGPTARAQLTSLPGIGPWTAAEVTRVVHGDPDALSVGDYHVPHLVAWALAGEPRGDDARMLELLEPYRGQRGRVVRLLELSGMRPPAFGPRIGIRSIAFI